MNSYLQIRTGEMIFRTRMEVLYPRETKINQEKLTFLTLRLISGLNLSAMPRGLKQLLKNKEKLTAKEWKEICLYVRFPSYTVTALAFTTAPYENPSIEYPDILQWSFEGGCFIINEPSSTLRLPQSLTIPLIRVSIYISSKDIKFTIDPKYLVRLLWE